MLTVNKLVRLIKELARKYAIQMPIQSNISNVYLKLVNICCYISNVYIRFFGHLLLYIKCLFEDL